MAAMPPDSDPRASTEQLATPPAIDDVVPHTVVTPSTPQEVADLLADAASQQLAVAPVGGGSSLALGNPPDRLDWVLSTANLRGIIGYEPTDLTLSVEAGARFGDVQAILAEHGQTIPLEAPRGDDATIGGLIATALSGPRRLGSGSLRDLLIGISVAHPSGTVTKAGGMVVKNVTGFDLTRLYHGSLGTLGVVVSANFKVLPLPRAEATLVQEFDAPEPALAAAGRIRATRLLPTSLEVACRNGAWFAAVRFEGREHAVQTQVAEGQAHVGDARLLSGSDSAAWWRAYLDVQAVASSGSDVLVRCAVRPSKTGDLTRSIVALLSEHGISLDSLSASVGLGTVVARCSMPAGSSERLAALQSGLLSVANHTTILAAPTGWKRELDVWGRPPETLDVMRSLKEQFDPARVLNPGRFAGRI
jgi:glycolate oxidase FAD binding subunit